MYVGSKKHLVADVVLHDVKKLPKISKKNEENSNDSVDERSYEYFHELEDEDSYEYVDFNLKAYKKGVVAHRIIVEFLTKRNRFDTFVFEEKICILKPSS